MPQTHYLNLFEYQNIIFISFDGTSELMLQILINNMIKENL